MINSAERAYTLVKERGASMFTFCKEHHLPYSTINEVRKSHRQLKVKTIYMLCDALGISISDFFEEEGESPHAGQESTNG